MRWWGWLILGIVACGGGGSDDGGGGGAAAVSSVPCGAVDTVLIDGTLDGTSVAAQSKPSGFAWINVGKPPKFDGSWMGGTLHLEWGSTIPNGSPTTVTAATLELDASAKPRTFQSGSLVYDSPGEESTLRTELTFDTGHVNICIRRN